uniref:Secreted protein n=1 Tax=Anopheles darlingi TaxID=43151 RepID=A0A2M4DAM4_ANODA
MMQVHCWHLLVVVVLVLVVVVEVVAAMEVMAIAANLRLHHSSMVVVGWQGQHLTKGALPFGDASMGPPLHVVVVVVAAAVVVTTFPYPSVPVGTVDLIPSPYPY